MTNVASRSVVGPGSFVRGCYYSRPVKVQFVAKKIGRCSKRGPRAYTKLYARFQKKPGGKFEKWFSWSYTGTICGD